MREVESLILLCGLFRIAWIDGRERHIPNRILAALLTVRVILFIWNCVLENGNWIMQWSLLAEGFFLGGGMLLAVYRMFRGGLGAGDVKLFAVIGAYLGSEPLLLILFLSLFYGVLYSVGRLLMKRTDFQQKIPFAPWILLGVITEMILQ